jgi:hypothetical protein
MDGTREHHSEWGQPSSEDQKSYVLPRMRTLNLGQMQHVVGLGSHDKGRAHLGDTAIGRKPKIWKRLMSPLQRS